MLVAGPAQAGTGGGGNSLDGQAFVTCGKWVLKMHTFGKDKIGDYNDYVPPNFQTVQGHYRPVFVFVFGPTNFTMFYSIPDLMGVEQALTISGNYRQRGKKVNFQPTALGVMTMENTFASLGENIIFGRDDRVVDIPFVDITNPSKLRFKGRVKDGGDRLKVKFKARMLYDMQFELGSEFADYFGVKGVMKLRADTNNCPDSP